MNTTRPPYPTYLRVTLVLGWTVVISMWGAVLHSLITR